MAYEYKRLPLSKDERNRLINACETQKEKLVVITLLESGLRVSELASLTKNQIDWQDHTMRIFGKGGKHGTNSKYRLVPISPLVQPLLEPYLLANDSFGMSVRTIQRVLDKVVKRAQISRPINQPICPHVLRHTFAVNSQEKGISLSALQKLLGHDYLITTQAYLNVRPEQVLREFREKW